MAYLTKIESKTTNQSQQTPQMGTRGDFTVPSTPGPSSSDVALAVVVGIVALVVIGLMLWIGIQSILATPVNKSRAFTVLAGIATIVLAIMIAQSYFLQVLPRINITF